MADGRVGSAIGRAGAVGSVVAAIPVALGLLAPALDRADSSAPRNATAVAAARRPGVRAPAVKEFSIPLANLRSWAGSVVVTLNNVEIEGRSRVHNLEDDCEMHFGAHATAFQGNPDGLVLEPMNVCVQPFPGKTAQSDADWTAFGDQIVGSSIAASGVPRIWPEHLSGGSASNPDHAVELHPLTAVTFGGRSVDFAPNIFAGEYRGGVGEETALAIVQRTTVSVTRSGGSVDIAFGGGRIGNFTTLQLAITRSSIEGDGAGSFRMDGEVVVDDSTTVPVRVVTIKGSSINDVVSRMRTSSRTTFDLEALVLFSLSPKSLLDAANRSTGQVVRVERPLQLILYGTPDDQ